MEKLVGKFARAMQLATMQLRENLVLNPEHKTKILLPNGGLSPIVTPRFTTDPDALGEGIDQPLYIPSSDLSFALEGDKLIAYEQHNNVCLGPILKVEPVVENGLYVAWNITTADGEMEYSILVPNYEEGEGYIHHIFKCTEEELEKYNGSNHDTHETLLKYNTEATCVISQCGKYLYTSELLWMSGSPCILYSNISTSIGTAEERNMKARKLYITSITKVGYNFEVVAYDWQTGDLHKFYVTVENIGDIKR